MKPQLSNNNQGLVELIDRLAPLNNKFRTIDDPIEKIESMWDFGAILENYLIEKKIKLHDLLYKIYDPYSTVKMSYITRDLGSYSYRIFKYFKERRDIRNTLSGVRSYSVFREAIPLLFNPKYHLADSEKREIIEIVKSSQPTQQTILDLRKKKANILPISNPRNQKAQIYETEKDYLLGLLDKIKNFYRQNPTLPSQKMIDRHFWKIETRTTLVAILMALASESFFKKIKEINPGLLIDEMESLYMIVIGDTQSRARFRKWVMPSNELLRIAEAIHSLGNENYYREFRSKLILT